MVEAVDGCADGCSDSSSAGGAYVAVSGADVKSAG